MVPRLVSLLLSIMLCKCLNVNNLKLKQVLIFSRHNVRYPLGEELQRYSSKPWRQAGPAGFLTPRGALLEGYTGEYFAEWLKKEHFLQGGCPSEEDVYVYANALNRTIVTARAFVDSAFKNCNVTVHHANGSDPFFNPVIHNTTEAYKEIVLEEVKTKLQNNSKLKATYLEMNKLLNIRDSDICKQNGICDLNEANNTIHYKVGKYMRVEGPLSVANLAQDSFLMNYYDGVPLDDIAWGYLKTPEEWKLLTEAGRQYQHIIYGTVGEDTSKPLVQYLIKVFKNFGVMPKLILIVGHDNNMYSIAISLGFQLKELPNQFEDFPIGGKFVFQRWTDGTNDYLKVEHVYGAWSQLRNGTKYSLVNPPQRVLMRLNWCNTDRYGFCFWRDFVNKL